MLTGQYRPPTTDQQTFKIHKTQLERERERVIASLAARKVAIAHAKHYVDGGRKWVDKMKAEWDAWVERERAKGTSSITAEERKVKHYEDELSRLERQQEADQTRINMYNKQLRQAAYNYKLQLHKHKLDEAARQQAELQAKLEASRKAQQSVQAEMAKVKAAMDDVSGVSTASSSSSSPNGAGADAVAPSGASSQASEISFSSS